MEVRTTPHIARKFSGALRFLPLLLVAVFIVVFFTTWVNLFERWTRWDEGLSHGLLIIAAFFYFFYQSLPWQAYKDPVALRLGLLLLLVIFSATQAIAWHLNIIIIEQLAILPLLFLFYAFIYGLKTAWQQRLVFALLIFAIPVWDQLNGVLLSMSSNVVGWMVKAIGMPALIQGNSIFIPHGHILIADGCSGIRYFVIALALGYIISLLNHYNLKRMLVTLLLAASIGLLANWIRIFILILVGHETKMQSPLISDHEYFGWILFGCLCLPALYFAPVVRQPQRAPISLYAPSPLSVITAIILLVSGPLIVWLLANKPTFTDWQTRLATLSNPENVTLPIPVTRAVSGFHETQQVERDGTRVYISVDHYQRVDKTDKLVPYLPRLFNNEGWTIQEQSTAKTSPGVLTRFRQKAGTREVLQLQWLEVGPYYTGSMSQAKLLQIPAAITRSPFFTIVTLQTPCDAQACDNVVPVFNNLISDFMLLKDN
jgi:exosortase